MRVLHDGSEADTKPSNGKSEEARHAGRQSRLPWAKRVTAQSMIVFRLRKRQWYFILRVQRTRRWREVTGDDNGSERVGSSNRAVELYGIRVAEFCQHCIRRRDETGNVVRTGQAGERSSGNFRTRMHDAVAGHWQMLRAVVQGHFNYYAVPGKSGQPRRVPGMRDWHVAAHSCRRSQKRQLTWERMLAIAKRWLPRPRVLHPHPEQRFVANHPRLRAVCANECSYGSARGVSGN